MNRARRRKYLLLMVAMMVLTMGPSFAGTPYWYEEVPGPSAGIKHQTLGTSTKLVDDPEEACEDLKEVQETAGAGGGGASGGGYIEYSYTASGVNRNLGGTIVSASATYNQNDQELIFDLSGYPAEEYVGGSAYAYVGSARGVSHVAATEKNWRSITIPLAPGGVTQKRINLPPAWRACSDHGSINGYSFSGAPTVVLYRQVEQIQPDEVRPDEGHALAGDPINVINGNVSLDETDLVIPAPGLPLVVTRHYNSILPGATGSLGPRWTHAYDWCLEDAVTSLRGDSVSWKVLRSGRGQRFRFAWDADTQNYQPPFDTSAQLTAEPDGTWSVTWPGGIVQQFSPEGLLTSVHDAWDNTLTLSYIDSRLSRVEHGNGQYLGFQYVQGRLSGIRTPSPALAMQYTYNARGELAGATRVLAEGHHDVQYAYDAEAGYASHSLTQRVNAVGIATNWDYERESTGAFSNRGIRTYLGDEAWLDTWVDYQDRQVHVARVTRVEDDVDRIYEVHYDPVAQRVTDIFGPDFSHAADWQGHHMELGDLGHPEESTMADWRIEAWSRQALEYDPQHHVTRAAFALQASPTNAWAFEWDPTWGGLTRSRDPLDLGIEIAYERGSATRQQWAGPAGSRFEHTIGYHTNGLPAAITNANGHHVQMSYDAWGHPLRVVPEAGPWQEWHYNRMGHLQEIVHPGTDGDRITSIENDGLGRPVRVVYPDGLDEHLVRDAAGHVLEHVDRSGRTNRFLYAPGGKLVATERMVGEGVDARPVGASLRISRHYQTRALLDPLGRVVESYGLDSDDRPLTITNLEDQVMRVSFGLGAQIRRIERFDGSLVELDYDSNGWLTRQQFPDDEILLHYRANGQLERLEDNQGETTLQYDSWGVLTSQVLASGAVLHARYDPAGQVTNRVVQAGMRESDWSWRFDAGGRPEELRSAAGVFELGYNACNGAVDRIDAPNGLSQHLAYDAMDQLTHLTWRRADGSAVIAEQYFSSALGAVTGVVQTTGATRAFRYDDLGRLVATAHRDPYGTLTDESTCTYDDAGRRLTRLRNGLEVTYQYGEGNRLTSWTTGPVSGTPARIDLYAISSESVNTNAAFNRAELDGQRLTVSGELAYGQELAAGSGQLEIRVPDEAGNIGTTTLDLDVHIVSGAAYRYNVAGCLTNLYYEGYDQLDLHWDERYQLTTLSTGEITLASNTYDALGRRIRIEENGRVRQLVYDGIQCMAELDAGGTLQRTYTYGPGIDLRLAFTEHGGDTPESFFYLYDRQGNVLALTDGDGHIVEQYRYDAWGRTRVYDGTAKPIPHSAYHNRYAFQGREINWATGLYYFRARWYDPVTGRWLSKDPIGIQGGLNQYAGFENDPVNLTDPVGTFTSLKTPGGAMALAFMAEVFGSGLDAYDIADTFGDPCSKPRDRVLSLAGAAVGLALPGGGYGWGAKAAAKNGAGIIGDAARGADKLGGANVAKTTRWGPATGRGPLSTDVAATFRSGSYTEAVTDEASTLFRVHGGNSGAIGPYWTRTKPAGSLQSQMDSALNPAWGNTATEVTTIRIPKGTKIFEGAAAPQGNLLGGGNQIYIPQVNPSWAIP